MSKPLKIFLKKVTDGRETSPVGCLVFKTSEVLNKCLVGSTPTSSAINRKQG